MNKYLLIVGLVIYSMVAKGITKEMFKQRA